MSLELIRRIPVAGIAADIEWSHRPNTPSDWLSRGFILGPDGEHGTRVPPGKDGRIVSVVVRAEDGAGAEVAGEAGVTISISLVQLVTLTDSGTEIPAYRERGAADIRLGDLPGEVDITRPGGRVFPRIVVPPSGLSGSPVNLAFYVGVL